MRGKRQGVGVNIEIDLIKMGLRW